MALRRWSTAAVLHCVPPMFCTPFCRCSALKRWRARSTAGDAHQRGGPRGPVLPGAGRLAHGRGPGQSALLTRRHCRAGHRVHLCHRRRADPDLEPWTPHSSSRIPDLEPWTPHSSSRIPDPAPCTPNPGSRIPNQLIVAHQDPGSRIPDHPFHIPSPGSPTTHPRSRIRGQSGSFAPSRVRLSA